MTMLETLCMVCMTDKGTAAVCPRCGFTESAEAASPTHLPPRTLLQARYVVGRVLGEGGFGITYLGWDETLALRVAIKEFLPHYLATRSADRVSVQVHQHEKVGEFAYGLEKFLDEARLLARFADHPGIVAVRDFFAAHRTGYLVMNYLDGMTFQDYLTRQGGRIGLDQALSILLPVMDTLEEIHAAGLLHRDISPDNLFLPTGKPAKLIDFGAARAALGERSCSLSVIVKPGYAPEEQYRSRGQQGPWTDLYALGATFYCALTGQRPPPAPDRFYQDTLLPPSALGALLPPAAESILLKALAVRAEQRFQAVGEFRAALEWALEGAGTADRAMTTPSATPALPIAVEEPGSARSETLKDRYWLAKKLEQNEWGTTFLAVDQETRQQCLIKQFSLRRAEDWKSIELFEREAKTLEHLDHPHIPKYLDYFAEERQGDQHLFLVREYVPGKTLAQCMADGRHFTEQEVVAIARTLTEVLCYLHQFSPPLIHRDIKPDSILLSQDQQLYLVDFGAVQDRLRPGEGFTVAGTFDYMPPEQKKGKAVPASDIYSLGATLIHLLSRIPPSRLRDKDQRLQFRSQVNISREFGRILEKMVEPRLERRHQTAMDLRADLHKADVAIQQGQTAKAFDRRWLIAGPVGFLLLSGAILAWRYLGTPTTAPLPSLPPIELQSRGTPPTAPLPSLPPTELQSRDDAIGTQVTEGVQLATIARANVADYYAHRGQAPANRTAAGLSLNPTDTSGNYVTQVDIVNGRIDITYGNNANPAISGKVLSLTPYESKDFNVVWRCGNAPAPPNLRELGSAAGGHHAVYQTSTVATQYQSTACAAIAAIPGIPGGSPIRSQITEGLGLAAGIKTAVAEFYMSIGQLPTNRVKIGLTPNPTDTAGRFVKQVEVTNGRIDITYGNEANAAIAGKVLSLTPYEIGQTGSITWRCGNSPAPHDMQPLGSASGGNAAAYQASTVDNQYLPPDCRLLEDARRNQ